MRSRLSAALRASTLEDLLQALEVLAELSLCASREEAGGEAGDVALGGDSQPCPASRRLELVPDGELHRTVEGAQGEQTRLLLLDDFERRVELPAQ